MHHKKSPENIINKKNEYGHTPLYVASSNGKVNAIKMLLDMGADIKIKSCIGHNTYESNLTAACKSIYNVGMAICKSSST